jgi:ketosteroid isomerase-like protein
VTPAPDVFGKARDALCLVVREEIRFEPQEFIDADDRVVVVARLVGRGKRSGVDVSRTWAYVWTLRGGKALRMIGYADRADALKAVGLEG